jgi:hypothetical protein
MNKRGYNRFSLPWIFYNLATNPHVMSSIRDELSPIVSRKAAIASATTTMFEPEEVRALVRGGAAPGAACAVAPASSYNSICMC